MSEISYDERSSTWLLRMAKSSYGIGLTGERRLRGTCIGGDRSATRLLAKL